MFLLTLLSSASPDGEDLDGDNCGSLLAEEDEGEVAA